MITKYPERRESETRTESIILSRLEADKVSEFYEIRRNNDLVWTAKGKPYTSGETQLHKLVDLQASEVVVKQLIAEAQLEGFAVIFRGCTLPGTFDFGLLEDIVFNGAREAYLAICAAQPNEKVSGFALFTDYDGMTLCPVGMATTSFNDIDDIEEREYYLTNPSEWPYSTDAGLWLAHRLISVAACQNSGIPFEREINDYFEQFFDACTRAIARLDDEHLFGHGPQRDEFLLLFGISDCGPTKSTLRRLNPESVYSRFQHCFDD